MSQEVYRFKTQNYKKKKILELDYLLTEKKNDSTSTNISASAQNS